MIEEKLAGIVDAIDERIDKIADRVELIRRSRIKESLETLSDYCLRHEKCDRCYFLRHSRCYLMETDPEKWVF